MALERLYPHLLRPHGLVSRLALGVVIDPARRSKHSPKRLISRLGFSEGVSSTTSRASELIRCGDDGGNATHSLQITLCLDRTASGASQERDANDSCPNFRSLSQGCGRSKHLLPARSRSGWTCTVSDFCFGVSLKKNLHARTDDTQHHNTQQQLHDARRKMLNIIKLKVCQARELFSVGRKLKTVYDHFKKCVKWSLWEHRRFPWYRCSAQWPYFRHLLLSRHVGSRGPGVPSNAASIGFPKPVLLTALRLSRAVHTLYRYISTLCVNNAFSNAVEVRTPRRRITAEASFSTGWFPLGSTQGGRSGSAFAVTPELGVYRTQVLSASPRGLAHSSLPIGVSASAEFPARQWLLVFPAPSSPCCHVKNHALTQKSWLNSHVQRHSSCHWVLSSTAPTDTKNRIRHKPQNEHILELTEAARSHLARVEHKKLQNMPHEAEFTAQKVTCVGSLKKKTSFAFSLQGEPNRHAWRIITPQSWESRVARSLTARPTRHTSLAPRGHHLDQLFS